MRTERLLRQYVLGAFSFKEMSQKRTGRARAGLADTTISVGSEVSVSAEFAYGGQAVIEGVVIRGRRTIALAVRRPSGSLYRYREPLRSPLQRSRVARLPFVRGLVVLWETLAVRVRMLMRSANVALEEALAGDAEAPHA